MARSIRIQYLPGAFYLNPVRVGLIQMRRGQSVLDYPRSGVADGHALPPRRRPRNCISAARPMPASKSAGTAGSLPRCPKPCSAGSPSQKMSPDPYFLSADGIQPLYADGQHGSLLRLPRLAPINGYEAAWWRQTSSNSPTLGRRDQNYFFRVRTIEKDNKIVGAMYGKIYGEIQFDVINAKTADLMFTYYLNPDGTENLEFDPKKNLFHLPRNESVNEP